MARNTVVFLLLVIAVLTASACCVHRLVLPASLEAAARSYRANRDLASLQDLMAGLRLGMSEREVVALLGEPTYCPTDGQCYYPSDKEDPRGFTITLVVEYRYVLYREDQIETTVTHRLESYSLFGVGE